MLFNGYSCFGSSMETKENSVVLSESESFWPRLKGRMKRKNKKQSSKPSPSSNYAVEISPKLINEKSAALVRIGSISRDGEFIPVILSPVRKSISNEPQVTKKKKKVKTLGFDVAEIKVKPRDGEIEISVKSRESEVCIQEFAPNQISEEQEEGAVRFRICSNARCHICSKTFHLPSLRGDDIASIGSTGIFSVNICNRRFVAYSPCVNI
jgi:hypothetical protein